MDQQRKAKLLLNGKNRNDILKASEITITTIISSNAVNLIKDIGHYSSRSFFAMIISNNIITQQYINMITI